MTFLLQEILEATGGRLYQGEKQSVFRGISTDSRTIQEGELFVALKGPRFDGHHYALEALRRKAGGVVVETSRVSEVRWDGDASRAVIGVGDTLRALGDLARQRRRKYGTPVVALTGSNGKTTTKELIAACLETRMTVLKSRGNLNNLIGLPLTLLGLTGREEVVVLEMGMNVPGEIRRLTEISEPDVGLITNIQEVHLEGLGSLERVKEEKGELFRGMKRDGTIVVNRDDPRVVDLSRLFPGRKITVGLEGPADVEAREVHSRGLRGTAFRLTTQKESIEITLPCVGRHFVSNALAASAVAMHFGIEGAEIKKAVESFRPFPMRMEVSDLPGGVHLINDAYNANPRSMQLALETLREVGGKGRSIAVLGDMLELGDFSEEAHRNLGRVVKTLSIDYLITLGERSAAIVESAIEDGFTPERTGIAKSHAEAARIARQWARKGDWILVKGSRGMAMEKVVEALREEKT